MLVPWALASAKTDGVRFGRMLWAAVVTVASHLVKGPPEIVRPLVPSTNEVAHDPYAWTIFG
jgi:hypothetical protein